MKNAFKPLNLTIALVAVLCIVLTIHCSHLAENSPIGRYVNNYEEGARHYIELLDDHTFIYHYEKDTIAESLKANWELLKEKQGDRIFFSTWKSYGPFQAEGCSNCAWSVALVEGELFFSYMMRKEMNFHKE